MKDRITFSPAGLESARRVLECLEAEAGACPELRAFWRQVAANLRSVALTADAD